ncbi:MAG: PadR family transcriptional regulator [Gaiellaceae bacterium]
MKRGDSSAGASQRSSGAGRGQGLLEPALLAVLASRPSHGYELQRAVEKLSGGLICMDSGGMYRVLRRLEEDGFVASNWAGGDHGPQRRRYELTNAGRALLEKWVERLRRRDEVIHSVIELVEHSLVSVAGASARTRP